MSKTLNESAGKFFMGKNILSNENDLDYLIAKSKQEKEEKELQGILLDAEKAKQEEIDRKLQTLELMPLGNKVIIEMYPRNPYRKILNKGIIVDYDGSFLNPDTGEMDKEKELVACARVIEVGPECKYVQVGDDVYFDTRTVVPIPFMSMGYRLLAEQQVFCVINEKLKERFNMS